MRLSLAQLGLAIVGCAAHCIGQAPVGSSVGGVAQPAPVTVGPASASKKTEGRAGRGRMGDQLQIETVKLGSEQAGVYSGLKCDSDGNLYLGGEPDGVEGILKLNAKGERLAVFQLRSPDVKVTRGAYYSIGPAGEVYQLTWAREASRYVFIYKPDGSLKSEIKLQPGFVFSPHKVAPFLSGDLFVSGLERDQDPDNPVMWPFQGIFSSSGSLLKELSFGKDDDEVHDMAAAGDKHLVLPANPSSNLAIAGGSAATGPDGNVYLMRRLSPAVFYAISNGGAFRRFTVDPGQPDFMPSAMHIAGARIAILFRKELTREEILKVVDLEGNAIATYDEPVIDGKHALGPAFACYADNPERFIFLTTTDDNRLGLVVAKPQ
jgi:hypothetical protein